MKLIITIKQVGLKVKSIETDLSSGVTMDVLKKLWETEQFLNNLPGANLRIRIDVTE